MGVIHFIHSLLARIFFPLMGLAVSAAMISGVLSPRKPAAKKVFTASCMLFCGTLALTFLVSFLLSYQHWSRFAELKRDELRGVSIKWNDGQTMQFDADVGWSLHEAIVRGRWTYADHTSLAEPLTILFDMGDDSVLRYRLWPDADTDNEYSLSDLGNIYADGKPTHARRFESGELTELLSTLRSDAQKNAVH